MGKKTILGLAIGVWVGLTVTGCQSSDSGSGSRLMARQSSSPLNQPVTGAVYNPSGNKGLGISNSPNGSTGMSSANGVQQASAMQNGSVSSTAVGPASSTSSTPIFDQGGQVVSRPMGGGSVSSGPVPPTAPGSYALPPPNAYTPPANPEIPVRKPGDVQ